jgi:hypothetical protein
MSLRPTFDHAWDDDDSTAWKALNAHILKAYSNLDATVASAKSQGFWVSSWYVGANTTRDLISANID